MYEITPLKWAKCNWWVAESPSTGAGWLSIAREEGKYYSLWNCDTPFNTFEEAMIAGQAFHNDYLKNIFGR
jgi:hypothetical protein